VGLNHTLVHNSFFASGKNLESLGLTNTY